MARMMRKKMPQLFTAAAAGLLGVASASQSQAALVFDIRATGVTGAGTLVDAKTVSDAAVGTVINYQIFAQVSGAAGNTALEGFQAGEGVIQSSGPGTVQANLSFVVDGAFDDAGFSNGVPTNLGGDSDIDIGTNPGAHTTSNIIWRSASMTLGNASGLGTSEFLLGSGTMTVSAVGDPTVVNFFMAPAGPLNPRPQIQVDGAAFVGAPASAQTTIAPGINVSAVPEPAALGLLGLAGLAALRRRRA